MSQLSDIYPASLTESGEFDDSSYLLSDSLGPDNSASQTTQSLLPLSVPLSLKRTKDPTKTYVIFEDMNKEEFVNWWIQTQSGQPTDIPKIWDRKGYRADIWADFDQVAHYISGQPKVMCKHCGAILNHPNSVIHPKSGKQGTTALRRHLTRATCKGKGKGSSLQRLLQHQVRYQINQILDRS